MKLTPLMLLVILASFIFAPNFMISMVMSVMIFGSFAFAGAWLIDRYGNLPGENRRKA